MSHALWDAVGSALGVSVRQHHAVGGGDINDAYRATLEDGTEVFVKTHRSAPPDMYPREAEGLAWLAEPAALSTPRVLAVSSEASGPYFLALEWLESSHRVADFDERLGRGLAGLHRSGAPEFGWRAPNYIGSLPQTNEARSTWAEFYRDQRLLPLIRRAEKRGSLDAEAHKVLDRLLAKLDQVVGPDEPPARLHGDLWGGNLHVDDAGTPCLIDPAVYVGHREIDLAMMRLFGGFGARVFAAYHEAYPLAPGHEERVSLYQLYPLLVHLNLFGTGYLAGVASAARKYV